MSIFKKGMFTADPSATPDQIAARRALMAMLRPKYGSAKYVGEGLGQLFMGIGEGVQASRLDATENAGREQANALFSGLFGRNTPTASTSGGGAPPGPMNILGVDQSKYPIGTDGPVYPGETTPGGLSMGVPVQPDYVKSIIGTESGGRWDAKNNEIGAGGKAGHFGRVQFGQARLQEAMDAGAIPQGVTPEQFMASPELQMAAEQWHFADLESQLGDLVGKEVNGQVMDMGALVAMGHLGGAAGARKYVESGGAYNPSDSFGTSLADYAQKHGGKVSMSTQGAGNAMPSIPMDDLMAALANPWLAPEQRAVLMSVYDQQAQAADPMNQLALEKAQLEVDAMKAPPGPPADYMERMFMAEAAGLQPGTPEYQAYLLTGELPRQGGDMPAAFAALDMQAQAAGLIPGTPEYQEFMINGGGSGTPAAFVALDMQAKAAGFEPGTPEYQEFMATRGAGFAAAAVEKGKAQAEAEIAAPGDVTTAETTLSYIDSIRNHPGRGAGSGGSAFLGAIPGTSAKEFQIEVDRLKAGAFMTAIEQLRGMGALSNAEGQTATAAVAALDPYGSEEGFMKRLAEYEAIVKRGMERAKKRIKAPADAAAPAAPTGNPPASGKRLKFNPATGDFE